MVIIVIKVVNVVKEASFSATSLIFINVTVLSLAFNYIKGVTT
jgi:hypothetical protein